MTHKGKDYLLAVDYLSKFPEIALLERKTAACVIMHLKSMFARHGIADHLIRDNMPFASCEFQAFAKEWRVKGALYRIWCGVNRLGDSGVKVV